MRRVSSTNWKTQINSKARCSSTCLQILASQCLLSLLTISVKVLSRASKYLEVETIDARPLTFFQRRFAATLCAFSLKKVPLLFLERSCNFLPTTERWREELQPLFCYHRSRSGVVFISSTKSFKFFRLRFAGKSCSSWNRMFSIHLLLCCRSSCLYRTEVSGTCWGTESGKI